MMDTIFEGILVEVSDDVEVVDGNKLVSRK